MKKGDLVLLSCGEYSDFEVMQLVRTLKDADAESLVESYLQAHPEERHEYDAFDRFIAWLIRNGCVEPLDYHEFHLGSYGIFRPSEY